MLRIILSAFVLFGLMLVAASLRAAPHGVPQCRACGVCEVCYPTTEQVTEKENDWKVACEKKCIPAIRLPWEPGGSKLTLFSWWKPNCNIGRCDGCSALNCDCARTKGERCAKCVSPRCGAVRSVSVLSEDSREVTTCKCKWEIRQLPWRIKPERRQSECNCSAPALLSEMEGENPLPLPHE